jgi:hypothetical protein
MWSVVRESNFLTSLGLVKFHHSIRSIYRERNTTPKTDSHFDSFSRRHLYPIQAGPRRCLVETCALQDDANFVENGFYYKPVSLCLGKLENGLALVMPAQIFTNWDGKYPGKTDGGERCGFNSMQWNILKTFARTDYIEVNAVHVLEI